MSSSRRTCAMRRPSGGPADYLFHNNRDGTFTNVTDRAGVAPGRHTGIGVWWTSTGRLAGPVCRERLRGSRCALSQQPRRHVHGCHRSRDAALALFVDGLGPRRREQRRPLGLLSRTWRRRPCRRPARDGGITGADARPGEGSNEIRQFPSSALYLNTGTAGAWRRRTSPGRRHRLDLAPLWEDLDNDGGRPVCHERMYREIHNQDMIARRTWPAAYPPADRSCGTVRHSPRRTSRFATWRPALRKFRAPGLDHKGELRAASATSAATAIWTWCTAITGGSDAAAQ